MADSFSGGSTIILFYKIINGLEEVPSIKGILIVNSHFGLRHFALGVSDLSLQMSFVGPITNSKTYKISQFSPTCFLRSWDQSVRGKGWVREHRPLITLVTQGLGSVRGRVFC